MSKLGSVVVSRPRGRPKGNRDDVTVKIDRVLASRARAVASHRGVPLNELLTGLLKGPVDRAFLRMLRDMEQGGAGK